MSEIYLYSFLLLGIYSYFIAINDKEHRVKDQGETLRQRTSVEQVAAYGYPVRAYELKTRDGYLLQVHNIPRGKDQNADLQRQTHQKRSVLILPCIFCSSYFFYLYQNQSLPLLLADSGYDVWVADFRAQSEIEQFSENPATFGPDGWFFSQDEIANYDVPAFIDLVLAESGNTKLSLVGFSMGNTVAFQALASLPQYNQKVDILIALAPAVYVAYGTGAAFYLMTNPLTRAILMIANKIAGEQKLPISGKQFRDLTKVVCQTGKIGEAFCRGMLFKILGKDKGIPSDKILLATSHFTAASIRMYMQYYQHSKNGRFAMYDMGSDIANNARYGFAEPPLYNLSQVMAPVVLFNGRTDQFNPQINVDFLNAKLPNVIRNVYVDSEQFSHFSFISNENVYELVNKPVLEFINNAA